MSGFLGGKNFQLTSKLYFIHIRYAIKAGAQFKTDFITAWIANVVEYLIMYMQVWILTRTYPVIGGWSYSEIILLMAMQFFTYSIVNTALYGVLHNMDVYINNGELDRMMVRPVNPVFSIVWKQFNWTGISQIALSAVFLIYGLSSNGIVWTYWTVGILILCLLGAIALQCGVFLMFGASAFWLKRSASLSQMLFYNFSSFSNYPITIFGTPVRVLLSTILPWAYINFYPAARLLNKNITCQWLYLLTPVLGALALVGGNYFMKLGLARYESVGN